MCSGAWGSTSPNALQWRTIPLLVLSALRAGLIEEVLVVAHTLIDVIAFFGYPLAASLWPDLF